MFSPNARRISQGEGCRAGDGPRRWGGPDNNGGEAGREATNARQEGRQPALNEEGHGRCLGRFLWLQCWRRKILGSWLICCVEPKCYNRSLF
jgi:hypothetical protein